MKNHKVTIETDKCVGCGVCAKVCVAHNIRLNNKKAEILLEDCVDSFKKGSSQGNHRADFGSGKAYPHGEEYAVWVICSSG